MKSSLSSLATHAMSAPSGLLVASVSTPTMTCLFSRRSTRCVSTPKGRRPCSRPASSSVSQRYSPYSAGKWISQPGLAHEADAQQEARHAGHLGLARQAM